MIKTVLILLLTFFNIVHNTAQPSMQDSLQKQFTTYQQNRLQEKIYVHTDKAFYLAGEICWFKIYNVEAFFNTPLSINKVVYVEMLDTHNKPVLQAKIAMDDGNGNGSFALPTSLVSGNYKLRAYTNWMKNFDPDYFFEKTVTIINSKAVYESDTLQQKDDFHLTFFPEGGNLVQGIQSKIAFHLVNQQGKGMGCSGVILNNKNDTVAYFETLKFGIGSFFLTPKINETYKAFGTLSDGQKITQELPIAYANGYVMQLSETDNKTIKITVQASNTQTLSEVYLFVHTRGVVKSTLSSPTQNGNATFLIDKNKIGNGISHFTVFNEKKQAVCERLYFKYPEQYLQVGLTLDEPSFGLRKKINLHITTTDQDAKPLFANMSMAVYALDSLQGLDGMDINNYLWLSSDLIGTIESPAYYFSDIGINTKQAVDNLMLTHGWRRFKWEDILQNQKPTFEFLPEYVGHLVTGKITKNSTHLPAQNIETYLTTPSTRTQFRPAISDKNGRVQFDMKDFYNDGRIIVQTNGRQDSLYDITIANPFAEKYAHSTLPAFSLAKINATTLLNHNTGMQVQNFYNGKTLKQWALPTRDTSPFYIKPDVTYLLDDYVRFTSLEEVITEYVRPVSLNRTHPDKNGKVHLQVWNALRNKFFDPDPIVLLDGMPVLDRDKLLNYDPLKIRKLEIVSRMYYLGNMSFYGILNFVTYTGQLPDYEFDPHTTVMDYEGLQKQRVFYSPEYETSQQVESRLPDFRKLLYWSPTVKTNDKGKQDIPFYSSDLPGKYVVVVQGLSLDGKIGNKMILFEVR